MGGTSEFRVDRTKNRLYIKLSGFFRSRDVPAAMETLEAALRDVEPGFDTITDLSEFVPASPGATAALTEGAEMVVRCGRGTLPNSHAATRHQLQHQSVSWVICAKDDFINDIFLDHRPMYGPLVSKCLFESWRITRVIQ